MSVKIIQDNDVSRVLKEDGVDKTFIGEEYENLSLVQFCELKEKMGEPPWAIRIVYNKRFGGVLICQNPGEGNRLHYHPDADECWVILEGSWEWYIDGKGKKRVEKNDIVTVKEGTPHQITCVGENPGIRFAITAPDVNHVYLENGDK